MKSPAAWLVAVSLARAALAANDTADPVALEKACGEGSGRACARLGVLYATGDGVLRDTTKAASLYESACDHGDDVACLAICLSSEDSWIAANSRRRPDACQKACDAGRAPGCYTLGVLCEQGKGVTQDKARAAGLYRKACDSGEPKGCANLAVMYATGEGVAASGTIAADMAHRAGILYLKQGQREDALKSVEFIKALDDAFEHSLPNGFLAEDLLKRLYSGGQ